jgi:hypothetical protein
MKLGYKKRQRNYVIKTMEKNEGMLAPDVLKRISLLDAIFWVKAAWKDVRDSTF